MGKQYNKKQKQTRRRLYLRRLKDRRAQPAAKSEPAAEPAPAASDAQ